MWPRVAEVSLGCWLLMTPFVFRGTEAVGAFTTGAMVCGALVITASLLSFWRPARGTRYVTLLVSLWLTGHGYFAMTRPGPPVAQNEIIIGLLLLLFAVLPNDINEEPEPWRAHRDRGSRSL